MEDAHVGVVDVCEHFGVELCSGCGRLARVAGFEL